MEKSQHRLERLKATFSNYWQYIKQTPTEALKYVFTLDEAPMHKIDDEGYKDIFIKNKNEKDVLKAYEQAWQAKNFEIDNYWKRANYFWLSQAASFTGYFAVLGTTAYTAKPESA